MTDSAGTVVARYAYDPFGTRTKVSGGGESDFGFTGHYLHKTSGLHLAKYRGYSSELGRWISRDPIGEDDGTNIYAYVINDPVNDLDMLGLNRKSKNPLARPEGGTGGGGSTGMFGCGTGVWGGFNGSSSRSGSGASKNSSNGGGGKSGSSGQAPNGNSSSNNSSSNSNPNTAAPNSSASGQGPGTVFVDSKGNAVVTPVGGGITGSSDGKWIQARDASGKATGIRKDGGHNPLYIKERRVHTVTCLESRILMEHLGFQ